MKQGLLLDTLCPFDVKWLCLVFFRRYSNACNAVSENGSSLCMLKWLQLKELFYCYILKVIHIAL